MEWWKKQTRVVRTCMSCHEKLEPKISKCGWRLERSIPVVVQGTTAGNVGEVCT